MYVISSVNLSALSIAPKVHSTSASSAAIHKTHPGAPSPLCISKALSTAGKGMDGQGCSFPPRDGVCSYTTQALHQLQQVQRWKDQSTHVTLWIMCTTHCVVYDPNHSHLPHIRSSPSADPLARPTYKADTLPHPPIRFA